MTTKPKSKPIADLERLGKRLAKDGYPTASIESAVYRMEQMEQLIVKNMESWTNAEKYVTYMFDALEETLGPASDDVMAMIREDYDGTIPEGW